MKKTGNTIGMHYLSVTPDITNSLTYILPSSGNFKQLFDYKLMGDLGVLGEHGNLGSGTVNHVPGSLIIILFSFVTLNC